MTMTDSKVAAAKELLASAAKAADQLEHDVRELVSMRAWEVLGYGSFSEMWEQENGFTAPTHVQVIAVAAMANEGMNTRLGRMKAKHGANGHTHVEIAQSIGLPYHKHNNGHPNGSLRSPTVQSFLTQLGHGVPVDKVMKAPSSQVKKQIEEYGDRPYEPMHRKRSQPRRIGKTPDELVSVGLLVRRRDDDEMKEIARQANIPKAELYRQAVVEYLVRQREAKSAAS